MLRDTLSPFRPAALEPLRLLPVQTRLPPVPARGQALAILGRGLAVLLTLALPVAAASALDAARSAAWRADPAGVDPARTMLVGLAR